MTEKLELLEKILEAMLMENEKITTRAVIRRSDRVFKHPTDLTRNDKRRSLLNKYVTQQATIGRAIERTTKSSRSELERLIALKNAEISSLKGKIELLVASHRATFLAITEMGGFNIWKKFFDKQQTSLDVLGRLGALPVADVVPHQRPE
ncbi:hypothetical protein [Bradyrhizobium sp. SYSU BS000235]|uniref:hypothetical protein n=1 Tax=Bradyrhizobium sp. SYSU BS000235 TaxID=3411332 RepID=UPI003C707DB0